MADRVRFMSSSVRKITGGFLVHLVVWVFLVQVAWADKKIDPSNPTQLNTSINPGYDYRRVGDATVRSLVIEGQVAGPSFLLLAELGYGENSKTNKSDWRDARVRFFHLPYSNESSDAWVNAFGWSIDAFLPIGDYSKGISSGNRVISPGIITAHNFNGFSLYPNLIYNLIEADDDDLKINWQVRINQTIANHLNWI